MMSDLYEMATNSVKDDYSRTSKRTETKMAETMVVQGDFMFCKNRTEVVTNSVKEFRQNPSQIQDIKKDTA